MPFLAPIALPLILGGTAVAGTVLSRRSSNSSGSSSSSSISQAQLDPLIRLQTQISESAGRAGQQDISSAREGIGFVQDFYKKILSGSDDDLMQLLDVTGATRNIDENEQLASELGVRGGRRAAALGQASFSRDAALNNMLKQLRFATPNQLAQLNQVLANIGLGELSTAVGAGAQASNSIFNVANLNQQEADRRNSLINNIISTAGSIAGIFAGRS